MQFPFKTLLIDGVVVLALAAAVPAVAQNAQTRTLTIALPGGGTEQIVYTGSVAPEVVVSPAPAPFMAMPMPGYDPAFAALDRMAAALDRQADMMLREAGGLSRAFGGAFSALPPGVSGYSVVSTFSSNGDCTRTTEVTYAGNGAAPRAISNTSGACGRSPAAQRPSLVTTPVPPREAAPEPRLVEASWRS
jgi:hypothetical protein